VRAEQSGALQLLKLPEPTEQDVQALAQRTAARIERVLRKAGHYLDAQDASLTEPTKRLSARKGRARKAGLRPHGARHQARRPLLVDQGWEPAGARLAGRRARGSAAVGALVFGPRVSVGLV